MRTGLTFENLRKSFKEFDIEKARSGIYLDTPENRRLKRVGVKYGQKTEREIKEREILPDFLTAERHSLNGIYSSYRRKVHKNIEGKILKNAVISEKPTVTLLMGGAASGKTTASAFFRDKNDLSETTYLSGDDIKEMLPEYYDFAKETAAANVHDEAGDIANSIRKIIVDNKINFVNDATLKNAKKAKALVELLKKQGYKIRLLNVTVSVDEAKRREAIRFKRTGRRVPESALEDTHIGAVESYEAIKDLCDEFYLLDNEVPFGTPPKVVDSHRGGVVNKDRYAAFKEKANYKRKK